jgi:hypothetical protein
MAYQQVFLGQDGNKIVSGLPDNFSKYFDWQVVLFAPSILLIRKKVDNPKTIYLKTDFLPEFVNNILPLINDEFILITACSDFSPEVDFKSIYLNRAYRTLLKDPRLKFWFMNNMKTKTEKSFSLPVGLAAGKYWEGCTPEEVDKLILKIRDETDLDQKIENKIFCCFRPAWFNVSGEEMLIRPSIGEIVKKNLQIFDVFEPDSLPFEKFVRILSKYKYALCPQGNGMDPSPTSWLSLSVKTTPVIYRNPNTTDMFSGTDSVIFFDKFEEITDKNLYIEKSPIAFEFLTCEYWANKIKSKIL